jgi:hypothetical protein
VFGHRQLLELGLSPAAIARQRRSGRWITHHRGVYGLAGAPLTPRGREFGAMLAGGQSAGVSHRAAGAHWRVRAYTPPMEITVPGPAAARARICASTPSRRSPRGTSWSARAFA